MKTEIKIVYNSEWEEYQVQWIEDGIVNESKTYHTEDEEDAKLTKIAMEKELNVTQFTRIDQMGDTLNIPKRK